MQYYSVWRHLLPSKSQFLHYKHDHDALKPNINLCTSGYYLSAQDILFIKKIAQGMYCARGRLLLH